MITQYSKVQKPSFSLVVDAGTVIVGVCQVNT
jgi:hypothetical protein